MSKRQKWRLFKMMKCNQDHKATVIYNAKEKKCKGFYCGVCKEEIKAIGRERKLKPEKWSLKP